jgi:hypothetical protein
MAEGKENTKEEQKEASSETKKEEKHLEFPCESCGTYFGSIETLAAHKEENH